MILPLNIDNNNAKQINDALNHAWMQNLQPKAWYMITELLAITTFAKPYGTHTCCVH